MKQVFPKALVLTAFAFTAMLVTTSCQLSKTVSTDSDSNLMIPSDPRLHVYSGDYKLEGDRLIYLRNAADSVVEYRYCLYSESNLRDSLVKIVDTVKSSNDTNNWKLEGDTLFLSHPTKIGYTPIDSIPYRAEAIYLRSAGTGVELEGEYKHVGVRVVLLRSIPESSADSSYVRFLGSIDPTWGSKIEDTRLILRKNKWTTTIRSLVSWAEYQILEWNGGQFSFSSDSADFDIAIRKIDDNTVTLKGNRNGELVTLRMLRPLPSTNLYGDIAYSSSDISHHPGIEHHNPTSCPDGVDWYYDFLFANWREALVGGAARRFGSSPVRQSRVDRGFSQHAPFGLLIQ